MRNQYKYYCWGTYGKRAKLHPFMKWVPLGLCSSSHLKNILQQPQITQEYREAINLIILDRKSIFDFAIVPIRTIRRFLIPKVWNIIQSNEIRIIKE